MDLLSKTRRINRLLQKTAGHAVNFNEMAEALSGVMEANIYVVGRKGRMLGLAIAQEIDNDRIRQMLKERQFPEEYNARLMKQDEAVSNIGIDNPLSSFPIEMKDNFLNSYTTLVPIIGAGERIGTLILGRLNEKYGNEDLILAEYGATVIAMEILREKAEVMEEEVRSKAVVQMAIGSLSYSELEAVEHIFEELDGKEGLLVASKIADRVGITRSVIVNALRKLESAGVIESRSLGMKGTYIKVLNEKLLIELDKLRTSH